MKSSHLKAGLCESLRCYVGSGGPLTWASGPLLERHNPLTVSPGPPASNATQISALSFDQTMLNWGILTDTTHRPATEKLLSGHPMLTLTSRLRPAC